MNPDERDLRKALDARSAPPSDEFRSRLGDRLRAGPAPSNVMPAIATFVAIALVAAVVGVFTLSRLSHTRPPISAASGARITTPTPLYGPTTVELSAPSPDVVWALVADTELYRSTDQGATWERHSLPPDAMPRPAISFVSATEGWVMVGGPAATQCSFGDVTIWHTMDAGATWERIVSVTPDTHSSATIGFEQCKEWITFIDSSHGFVEAWDDNSSPTVYRTSDGGLTWSATRLPDPPGFVTTAGGDALRARPVRPAGAALLLVASGMQPDGMHSYAFRSDDLGASWHAIVKVPSDYVAFVTDQRWLLLVGPGQSQETTNAGQQWHPYASNFNTDTPVGGPQVFFADVYVGYAEGRGSLQRTTDGGLHWQRIETPGVFSSG